MIYWISGVSVIVFILVGIILFRKYKYDKSKYNKGTYK